MARCKIVVERTVGTVIRHNNAGNAEHLTVNLQQTTNNAVMMPNNTCGCRQKSSIRKCKLHWVVIQDEHMVERNTSGYKPN